MRTADIVEQVALCRWHEWPSTLLASIDLETTGLSPWADRIIEVAVILQTGHVRDSWRRRCHPGRPVPKRITNLTGISDEDLETCPRFDQLEFPYTDGALRVACNADFEAAFIAAELARYPERSLATTADLARPCDIWLDVQLLARALDGAARHAKGYRLTEMAERFGLQWHGTAHSALADADMALQVLWRLVAEHGDQVGTPEEALILQRLYMDEA